MLLLHITLLLAYITLLIFTSRSHSCPPNTDCSKCQQYNSVNYYLQVTSQACKTTCPPGRYQNTVTLTCDICVSNCATCTTCAVNATTGYTDCVCTSCLVGTVIYGQLCMLNCPSGYYNNSGICSPCSTQCLTCKTSNSFCLTCPDSTQSGSVNYYMYSNQCFSKCPQGYYGDPATLICKKCITNCAVCDATYSTNQCTTCYSGYTLTPYSTCGCTSSQFLFGAICLDTCPSGTYAETSNNTCINCPYQCAT